MSRRSERVRAAAAAMLAVGVLLAMPTWLLGVADTWKTAGTSGNFSDGTKWTDGSAPGIADSANFGVGGMYTVTFTGNITNQDLYVTQGVVTLNSSLGPWTYSLTGGGGNSINVSSAATTLNLGDTPAAHVHLVANNLLSVQSGGTLNVRNGSGLTAGWLNLGTTASGSPSTLLVDSYGGPPYTLQLTNPGNLNIIGQNGAAGNLTFQNGATGSFAGSTAVGYGSTNSIGTLTVQSGAGLTLNTLTAATSNISGQSGTITVTGGGSYINQSGGSTLILGAPIQGSAALTINSGGSFTTGTGTTTVNKTGTITIDTGGSFIANGNTTLDGGVLNCVNGTFIWADSRTMSIQNGGRFTRASGDFGLPLSTTINITGTGSKLDLTTGRLIVTGGSQVNVNTGGLVSAGTYLDVGTTGNGTLVVDGIDARAVANAANYSYWGQNGHTASVTYRNSATGQFDGGILAAFDPDLNTTNFARVESGAALTVGHFQIGTGGGGTAIVTVTGNDSSITQNAGAVLNIGHVSTGAGALNVVANGTYTTGTGTTTINRTGELHVNTGGTLNVRGDIDINGGVMAVGSPATLNWDADKTMTIQNGGLFTGPFHVFAPPADAGIVVTGASSSLAPYAVQLDNGAHVSVSAGGAVSGAQLLLGTTGVGGSVGALSVGDATSQASFSGLAGGAGSVYLGFGGGTGNLTLKDNSSSAFGEVLAATDTYSSTTSGNLDVLSGAQATIGSLSAGTGGIAGQTAAINVNGTGALQSTITQSGAATLTLGAAGGSTATLTIATPTVASGKFVTGAGLTTVKKTGQIIINNGGVFQSKGDITIDGGVLQCAATGTLSWSGTATINVQHEGRFTRTGGTFYTPINAAINVSGASVLENTVGDIVVSAGAQLNVTGGSLATAAHGINIGASGNSTLVVDGFQSRVTAATSPYYSNWGANGYTGSVTFRNTATGTLDQVVLGGSLVAGSNGNLLVESGAVLTCRILAMLGAGTDSSATAAVSGVGSAIIATSSLSIGHTSGYATLYVGDAAAVTSAATGIYPTGRITIDGGTVDLGTLYQYGGTIGFYRGSLAYLGNLTVGRGGLFGDYDVMLGSTQSLTLNGTTTIDPLWTLHLDGGRFSTGSLTVNGAFNFIRGTLDITGAGGMSVGSGGPFGPVFTLGSGRNLNVTNATTVDSGATLIIDGGLMTTRSLSNAGSLMFQSGGLSASGTITNQSTGRLFIGNLGSLETPGPVSNNGRVELLGGAARLGGAGAFTNTGLMTGDGEIAKDTTNDTAGEIRAEDGKHLVFSGVNAANVGQINLLGGTAEFTQPLANAAAGVILGRGALVVGGDGLTNQGNAGFSGGLTDVLAKVNNAAGAKIVTSGGGTTTFWDSAVNDGQIRTSVGCATVFLGALSGSGTYPGTGTVYIEGDLSPGHSAAVASFGGDLVLTGSSRLEIELGGTSLGPPPQYDSVSVANHAALDGTLNVSLINGFRPAHNDQFTVLAFASRTGDFAAETGLDLGSRLQLIPQYTPTSLVLTASQGGSGTWRLDADGSSSAPANWSGGVPNGVGDVATFGAVITQPRTVSVDVPTTLGGMVFSNVQSYTIGGSNAVTLQATAGSAAVDVQSGSHEIAAPLLLGSPTDFQVAQPAGTLTIGGPIGGSGSLTKSGPGVLDIVGTIAYEGDTTVVGGELRVPEFNPATAATAHIDVQAGARLIANSIHADTLTIGAGASVTIRETTAGATSASQVPEPSMLMLLIAGGVSLLVWLRRRA